MSTTKRSTACGRQVPGAAKIRQANTQLHANGVSDADRLKVLATVFVMEAS